MTSRAATATVTVRRADTIHVPMRPPPPPHPPMVLYIGSTISSGGTTSTPKPSLLRRLPPPPQRRRLVLFIIGGLTLLPVLFVACLVAVNRHPVSTLMAPTFASQPKPVTVRAADLTEEDSALSLSPLSSNSSSSSSIVGVKDPSTSVVWFKSKPVMMELVAVVLCQALGLPLLSKLGFLLRRLRLLLQLPLVRSTKSAATLVSKVLTTKVPLARVAARHARSASLQVVRAWKAFGHVYKQTSLSKIVNRSKKLLKVFLHQHEQQDQDIDEDQDVDEDRKSSTTATTIRA